MRSPERLAVQRLQGDGRVPASCRSRAPRRGRQMMSLDCAVKEGTRGGFVGVTKCVDGLWEHALRSTVSFAVMSCGTVDGGPWTVGRGRNRVASGRVASGAQSGEVMCIPRECTASWCAQDLVRGAWCLARGCTLAEYATKGPTLNVASGTLNLALGTLNVERCTCMSASRSTHNASRSTPYTGLNASKAWRQELQ